MHTQLALGSTPRDSNNCRLKIFGEKSYMVADMSYVVRFYNGCIYTEHVQDLFFLVIIP